MVHGFCCGGEVWTRMAGSFRELGWRVEAPTLFPELRAKTDPPAELSKLTLGDYVAEMESTARRLEAETGRPPVVFGHSLGGLIAQKLAERGAARAVVLLSSVAPAGGPPVVAFAPILTFANLMFASSANPKAVKVWKTGFKWGMVNRVPRARHEELYADTRYDSGLAGRDMAQPDKDPSRIAYIDEARVVAPILTVGAGKDRANPIGMQRKVAEKYKRVGDYSEYADNAHWIIDEPGTDQVIADVARWLDAKVAR